MRLRQADIDAYAAWSGDVNPLHVDAEIASGSFFGRRIAHGMFSLTRALAETPPPAVSWRSFTVEFRGAVLPEHDCEIAIERAGADLSCAVRAGDDTLLVVRAGTQGTSDVDATWFHGARLPGRRPAPADGTDWTREFESAGAFDTGPLPPACDTNGVLTPLQTRVFALCSYIVGMEAPGLRSLFTRASLQFAVDPADAERLVYRVRRTHFDPQFRMLDTRVDVLRSDGTPVALAELRSYVRLTPIAIDPARVAASLDSAVARSLAGRVALVTGGTRGLGAQLTTALAAAGCTVYATYRSQAHAASALRERLNAATRGSSSGTSTIATQGSAVDLMRGDAADAAWCAEAVRTIADRHGRLDVLVLNACGAPEPMPFSATTAAKFDAYVSDNLRLASAPLSAARDLLEQSGGTIVCVSSSFVDAAPKGFGHYVALKQSVETLVRAAASESPRLAALITRPPRLQTAWNDTPAAVAGTIPAEQAAVRTIERAAGLKPREIAVLREFAPLAPRRTSASDAGAPAITVGLAASFTVDPVLEPLRFWFDELGVAAEIDVAPYAQIIQTLFTAWSAPSAGRRVNAVLLRVRDWLREVDRDLLGSTDRVRRHLESMSAELLRAIRAHRTSASADTLVILCPSAGADEHEPAVRDIQRQIEEQLARIPGVQVLAASAFDEMYGVDPAAIADPLREHIAHVPYSTHYMNVLATLIARHVFRRMATPRKVVVVDCDNTLWKGVVGEAGADGVEFGAEHVALQEALIRLAGQGMLLCLCSKNEEADVWRVFETRADLRLTRDHLVTSAVNWQPKSENIKALARSLNLGLDSFIFIDDNPVECAEVRSGCPEVLTLQWPQVTDEALALLQHAWELDGGTATAEDQRRTQLYKEEFKRQELLAETVTFSDFIASLDVHIDISALAPADEARASQLTLRTNQFNFTTIRRSESELRALLATGRHHLRTVRVRDKFGDYGLVGLLIAEIDGDVCRLDTFLVSCRVLGRGVEHEMAAEIGRIALANRASRVELRVEFTSRNTPARRFLESIAADEFRTATASALAVSMPAETVAGIRFEPSATAPEPVVEDSGSKTSKAAAALNPRQREQQIARAASLSTMERLARAIGGDTSAPVGAGHATADTDAIVVDAFATALGISAGEVRAQDRLEALGCDSFRIVEITVALTRHFPWLPHTLLFEHRSVSEIAAQIAQLSGGRDGAPAHVATHAISNPITYGDDGADIAVVGIDVRCAGAGSPDELWDLLSGGRVAVRAVPADRDCFLGRLEDGRPHWAGLLDGVDRFDPDFFGIAPKEAELMDPQLRLFLEVAWTALEDAGAAGADLDPDTGVFAGAMYSDYAHAANAAPGATPYKSWENFSLANRLSQLFGLSGPSLTVDTACSSSGTALHLACRALRGGDCRVAIVGGVNLILDPARFAQLGRLGILSATGRCLAFGGEADGTVLGEGAGVVILRPLRDAVARGDRIYGVIKGTGLSTGSGTVGFTAPNPVAQADAIRRALRASHVDPRTIGYVETHGTGTALGDPIEVRGLTLAYGDRSLWDARLDAPLRVAIGSIKPNIGHLEAGAGIVGLIKVLLQMQHRKLLPSVTSPALNAQIAFGSDFSVQRELADWPAPMMADGESVARRRAAISSFGVGGANAHVIVEEPPAVEGEGQEHRSATFLAISARRDKSLLERVRRIRGVLDSDPGLTLPRLAHSVNAGRRHFDWRVGVSARDMRELRERLDAILGQTATKAAGERASGRPGIAFLFTGQGAQYAGMGRALYEEYGVFRDTVDRCIAAFGGELESSLLPIMFGTTEDASQQISETAFTQPALFAFEVALAALWRSWGIVPDVVTGHSIGEIAAMCAAGGVSIEDAARLVAARGRLMQALPPGGGMTSVMATEAAVREALAGADGIVSIAAINGPAHVVLSGELDAVARAAARLAGSGARTKPLTVSHAFHSRLMDPMLRAYAEVVATIPFKTPEIAFVSTVTGAPADSSITAPHHWIRNVTDAVRFADAAVALRAGGAGVFLEVGPQPVLAGMARHCIDDAAACRWIASVRKDADDGLAMMTAAARVYEAGADFDWKTVTPGQRTSVPAYPFDRRRYWIKSPPAGRAAVESAARGFDRVNTGVPAAAYELQWIEQSNGASGASLNGRWIVLTEDASLGREFRSEIGTRGAIASAASTIEEALRAAGADAAVGVIFGPIANGADVAAQAERHLADITTLAQGLARKTESHSRLWIVTRGATTGAAPAQAVLWGFARTFALEHPHAWGGIIDLESTDARIAAAAVADELAGDRREDQISLARGMRLVPRLVPSTSTTSRSIVIDPAAVYLVTGGLGAIGRKVAEWLVNSGARALVLVSRTPPADTPDAVSRLRARGADVRIEACDVASETDVSRLIERITASGRSLKGIVHAAGVDVPAGIDALTADALQSVARPKIRGAWLLHEATAHVPLDFFVGMSSLAAVLGSTGRAHYAGSNAFLGALAAHRAAAGLPALTINWGPWAGGGMATADTLRQFERIGNYGLEPEDAIAALGAALRSGTAEATVAAIDWDVFLPIYDAQRAHPILEQVRGVAGSAGSAASAETQQLLGADDVEGILRRELAETLGFASPQDVPAAQPFNNLGLDSLMAAEFASRLARVFGSVSPAVAFEFPTIEKLSGHLGARAGRVVRNTDVHPTGASGASAAVAVERRAGVSLYVPDEAPEVFAFCRAAWPRRRSDWIEPRWRWMFEASAARIGVAPQVWLYRDEDGRIAGHNGRIAVVAKLGPSLRETGWLVDTMVLESHRSRAAGAQLMLAAHEGLPFALSLGQTPQMRAIQLRLGWQQVAPLQIGQLLIRPENVLKGKLPQPAARAAGLGVRAAAAVRGIWTGRSDLRVAEIARFERRHDDLWQRMAADVTCAVTRDASYLNWKYVEQPGQDFLRLDVFDGETLRASAVCMFREADEHYRYRRAFLVDLVAPLADEGLLAKIVQSVAAAAAARGADSLLCYHTDARLTRALRQSGFQMREPERYLLVRLDGLTPDERAVALAHDAWFLTHGDSDIDRP